MVEERLSPEAVECRLLILWNATQGMIWTSLKVRRGITIAPSPQRKEESAVGLTARIDEGTGDAYGIAGSIRSAVTLDTVRPAQANITAVCPDCRNDDAPQFRQEIGRRLGHYGVRQRRGVIIDATYGDRPPSR